MVTAGLSALSLGYRGALRAPRPGLPLQDPAHRAAALRGRLGRQSHAGRQRQDPDGGAGGAHAARAGRGARGREPRLRARHSRRARRGGSGGRAGRRAHGRRRAAAARRAAARRRRWWWARIATRPAGSRSSGSGRPRSCSTTASSTGRSRRTWRSSWCRARAPWGNGRLFPRGMLREPLAGLARAHAIVVTNPAGPAPVEAVTAMVRRFNPTARGAGGQLPPPGRPRDAERPAGPGGRAGGPPAHGLRGARLAPGLRRHARRRGHPARGLRRVPRSPLVHARRSARRSCRMPARRGPRASSRPRRTGCGSAICRRPRCRSGCCRCGSCSNRDRTTGRALLAGVLAAAPLRPCPAHERGDRRPHSELAGRHRDGAARAGRAPRRASRARASPSSGAGPRCWPGRGSPTSSCPIRSRSRRGDAWRRALAAERADVAVLLPSSIESALAAWRWRARRRVGYDTDGRAAFLTDALPLPAPRLHQVDEYAALLGAARRERRRRRRPRGRCGDDAAMDAEVARLLAEAGVAADARLVGLHLGAAFGSRSSGPRRPSGASRNARARAGLTPVLLGSRRTTRTPPPRSRRAAGGPIASLVGRDRPALLPRLLARLALPRERRHRRRAPGRGGRTCPRSRSSGRPIRRLTAPREPREPDPRARGAVRAVLSPALSHRPRLPHPDRAGRGAARGQAGLA